MSRHPDSDSRLPGAAPAPPAAWPAGGNKRSERTRQTEPVRDSQPKPIRQRLAWLPIPVFLAAIVVLWAVGPEAPRESVELAIALNVVFSVMVSLVVAYLIGRTFLVRGQPGMLLFGCGIVIWGVAAVAGFAATQAGAPPIAVHNTCVFLAAVCHVMGAWLLLKDRPGLRSAGLWLAAGYTMALGAVAIVALAGLAGRLPTFFIPGQGGTPLRDVVLGLSIAMFLVTAHLLRKALPASRSPFSYWYALALGLIAVGLFGVMIQPVRGSLLGWAGRAAQFASGIYMFVAAVASVRETGAWRLPLEAALRQSEERYRALFTSISEAFMMQEAIRDSAGNIIDFRFMEVNPAFEAQTGLSGVVGKTMREVIPDIEGEWIENYAKVVRTGEPMRFEQRAAALGRWFDVFASRVGGSASAGVAILFNDITARKQAEERLRQSEARLREANAELEQRIAREGAANAALRESRRAAVNLMKDAVADRGRAEQAEEQLRKSGERLRLAVEAADFGTWDLDLVTGRAIRSLRHDQIFGYQELQPEWSVEIALRHIFPEDRQRVREAHTPADGKAEMYVEARVQRLDGSSGWVMSGGRFHHDDQGRPVRIIGVCADITARKRAEMALMEQTSQLEAANKELESFSYSVSHDLRAPLRAITGYAQMILKRQGERFDEETRRRFQMITDNAETMNRLIDDLLAFSRLGSQDMAKGSLDMEELIGEVWQELVTIHPGRDMILKIDPIPTALGDRTLIRQVYGNLLGNAAKFTRERGAAVVEAGSCIRDGETVYYVRDNGVGFDMKFYDKLFGVFQRLHSDAEYKGTGIGLALVKRIINRHGGRIWAEGKVDEGATFYFTLPTAIK